MLAQLLVHLVGALLDERVAGVVPGTGSPDPARS
jgi:hypothetical protein